MKSNNIDFITGSELGRNWAGTEAAALGYRVLWFRPGSSESLSIF